MYLVHSIERIKAEPCNIVFTTGQGVTDVINSNHMSCLLQSSCGSGFFELQILEIANYRSELASGACCGSETRPDSSVPCPRPCSTFFRVCLKEYQSNVTSTGSCSFGNTSSPVLGGSSFTLADQDRANGKLVVPFIFRWTVSTTNITQSACIRRQKYSVSKAWNIFSQPRYVVTSIQPSNGANRPMWPMVFLFPGL